MSAVPNPRNLALAAAFAALVTALMGSQLVGTVGALLPPAIAPRQIVVVPMLRDKPEDAEVLEDLIVAACSDARAKVEAEAAAEMGKIEALRQFRQPQRRVDRVRRADPREQRHDGFGLYPFLAELRANGAVAHLRRARGPDIDAACGQLRRRETTQSPATNAVSLHSPSRFSKLRLPFLRKLIRMF